PPLRARARGSGICAGRGGRTGARRIDQGRRHVGLTVYPAYDANTQRFTPLYIYARVRQMFILAMQPFEVRSATASDCDVIWGVYGRPRVEALALRAHGVLGILCRRYAGLEHPEAC